MLMQSTVLAFVSVRVDHNINNNLRATFHYIHDSWNGY